MSYCVNCGMKLNDEYEFCPECGVKIESTMANPYTCRLKKCKKCGKEMPEDAFYCLNCGMAIDEHEVNFEEAKNRIHNTVQPQKRKIDTSVGVWKNKWITLILCIFFGVFGIHRFYEEKRITGFIYLLTFGVFGLGWFFDIILILTKTNPYRVK